MRFWSQGMGLQPLMEHTIDGKWGELFHASGDTLRSVFLHDPALDDAGIVELVEFPSGIENGTPVAVPAVGFFLLSFYVHIDEVLERLAALGMGGTPRRIQQPAQKGIVEMAVVTDPNGVLVELIDVRPALRGDE